MQKAALLQMSFIAFLVIGPTHANAFDIGREIGHCFRGGCDVVWDLNKRFDDGVRSKSENMAEPFKKAFLEATTDLFDKKINPMIDKIDKNLSDRIEQGRSVIKDAESGIDEIIERASAAATRQSLNIKQNILDVSFKYADLLFDKINSNINSIIESIDCKLDGQTGRLQEWIRAQFVLIPKPWDDCYVSAGYRFSTPGGDDYVNHYRIRKCEYFRDLDKSESVEDIRYNYARLSVLARRFRCITQNPLARQLMEEDGGRLSKSFETWTLASR